MQFIVDDNFIIILQICIWRIWLSLYIVNIKNNSYKIFFCFSIMVNGYTVEAFLTGTSFFRLKWSFFSLMRLLSTAGSEKSTTYNSYELEIDQKFHLYTIDCYLIVLSRWTINSHHIQMIRLDEHWEIIRRII
jgi:hypothetical protein